MRRRPISWNVSGRSVRLIRSMKFSQLSPVSIRRTSSDDAGSLVDGCCKRRLQGDDRRTVWRMAWFPDRIGRGSRTQEVVIWTAVWAHGEGSAGLFRQISQPSGCLLMMRLSLVRSIFYATQSDFLVRL